MRWFTLVPLLVLAACSTTQQLNITARPSDALISVDDGAQHGIGRLAATVIFKNGDDVHKVTATRAGYEVKTITLNRDDKSTNIEITLDPFKRRLSFSIVPVPALLTLDGAMLAPEPVAQISTVQPFTQDGQGNWTKYTVVATRDGWDPVTRVVSWSDPSSDYILQLQPKHKDVTINTTPPGATVTIDDENIGAGPAIKAGLTFPYDNALNQYLTRMVKVSKPGYDPMTWPISWDDGKASYDFALVPHQKTVHFITDPAGATVTINGTPVMPGPDGVATADLSYIPINDKGDLPVFSATIVKKAAETEWYPTTVSIPWEEGRKEYSATLKEITTRHVPELSIKMERDSDGVWQILPQASDTVGMKDVSEGTGHEPPTLLYQAAKGETIGTLAASPVGSQVLFTVLTGSTKLDLRSKILAVDSAGPGVTQEITDGKALDIMPSFNVVNADAQSSTQVVFSSNRSGRRLNIWRRPLNGGFPEQLTNGEEQDLWPMIDASPKPRVFYEVLSDSQPDPQLYMSPLGGASRTNLTNIPVAEPRISPLADSLLFTSPNQRTGNREIYRIPAKGGSPTNISNDPDSDCHDPAWSKDGGMIAYVCDRSLATFPVMQTNGEVVDEQHHDSDIWVIDLNKPDKPMQVTTNASEDDCPAWDPTGNYIYFRSNRGGRWGIWRISLK